MEPSDVFVCPTCGYQCVATWESAPDVWPSGPSFCARMGMSILLDLPVWTVCVHPDGTGSETDGEAPALPAMRSTTLVTPERAAQLLQSAVPVASLMNGRDA
jgi:hypothetical protein